MNTVTIQTQIAIKMCWYLEHHMNKSTKNSPKDFIKKLNSIGVLKEGEKGEAMHTTKTPVGTKCQWKQNMLQRESSKTIEIMTRQVLLHQLFEHWLGC